MAESDTVVVAIRLVDIMSMERTSIKNKILLKVAEMYSSSLMKR